MKDILTPEHRAIVENFRYRIEQIEAGGGCISALMDFRQCKDILAILDSMQAPKQYTEKEIEGWSGLITGGDHLRSYTEGAIDFARFLGVLKDQEEG